MLNLKVIIMDDAIDLILYLARQQINTVEYREDEVVHILSQLNENITITDVISSIELGTHPTKWNEKKWDVFTWG